ncbi:MAG: hypothetical protein L0G99_03200 [Propionibacteriales bacterium]|nr:hypothetical protein [Propionibacteriales bacterium]
MHGILPQLIVGSGLFASVSGLVLGWWLTGNRLSRWIRVVSAIAAAAAFFAFGFLLATALDGATTIFNHTFLLGILGILVLIAAYVGWVHLTILHPQVRLFWSLPFLTAALASASIAAQFLFAIFSSEIGVPSELVAIPNWLRVLVSLLVAIIAFLSIYCIVGMYGWAAYFGLTSGSLLLRAFSYLAGLCGICLWILSSFVITIAITESNFNDWRAELSQNRTPVVASEFLYRACVVLGEGQESLSVPDSPVVVIQGRNDLVWVMDAPSSSSWGSPPQPIGSKNLKIRRLGDGVLTC